jgi:biopolymer transport protein ExbD/biopolymer transport protein TolR
MAFSSGGRGGSRRGRWENSSLAEMNVVPLVDVVLVLLIIFMITAQAMEFGLDIEVPKVKETASSVKDMPVLSITRQGEMKLNELPLRNIEELGPAVRKRFGKDVNEIYLRGDRNLVFGTVAQVLSAASRQQLKVSVVTRQEDIR